MVAVPDLGVDTPIAAGVSADELAGMDSDGYRHDLLEGILIRVSAAGFRHGQLAALIAYHLHAFLRDRPALGVVVGAETGFRLAQDPDTVLGPDAAVVRRDRLPPAAERGRFLDLAPDLVVEIVSPGDRWTTVSDKVEAYLTVGVRLVWVFEPLRRAVRVYTLDGAQRRVRADRGDELEGADVLPGFRLSVAELFAALD